jgi:glutamine amidotransferase
MKVPHMGWNVARPSGPSPLTASFGPELRFYFVHSYFVRVQAPADSMLKTSYGVEFDSGIQRGHVFGVQFHPEKSHRYGLRILQNFASLPGPC